MGWIAGALFAIGLAGCSPLPVVIAAAGDLSPGGHFPANPLVDSRRILDGHLRFANLEGPITARGAESGLDEAGAPTGGPVRLRIEPARAAWLAGRLDVASIENNHALDQGEEGRADTIESLSKVGIRAVSAARPVVMHVRGQRISILARYYPPDRDLDGEHEIESAVAAARRAGPVLVSLHWGHTGSLLPTTSQRRLARRIVEAGASAVLGHGPHTIQGIELMGGAMIAYSLGNLAFGCRCTDVRDAMTLKFTLLPDGSVSGVLARPIEAGLQDAARPADDPGLFDLIANLSGDLGSIAVRTTEGLLIGKGLAPPD